MAVLSLHFCARAFSSCGKWGHSSSRCAGLSLSQRLLLQSMDYRRAGSVIVAHWPSCSEACGIFPDQGSNLCPLHWQADSQPLRHQGSPIVAVLKFLCTSFIISDILWLFPLVDVFSWLWITFFCFFACIIIFNWMSDIIMLNYWESRFCCLFKKECWILFGRQLR